MLKATSKEDGRVVLSQLRNLNKDVRGKEAEGKKGRMGDGLKSAKIKTQSGSQSTTYLRVRHPTG